MIGRWTRIALVCLVCFAVPGSSVHVLAVTPTGKGPVIASGILSRRWQADFPDGWSNVRLLEDVVVVTHGERLEGRDLTTGNTLWAFSMSDIHGYTAPEGRLEVTGDLVVAVAPRGELQGDSILVFKGRTGTVLWDLGTGLRRTDMPAPYFNFLGIGRSRAVIYLPGLRVLRGLDIIDGQQRWDSPLPSGCRSLSGDADESVAAVLLGCAGRTRLRALDPSTGRVLWDREVFPLNDPLITVSGGAVGLLSDHAFTVYDIDGRRLYEHIAGLRCGCMLAAIDTGLVILREEPYTSDFVVEAVDRRSGRVVRVDGGQRAFKSAWVVDGRIYGMRQLGDLLQGVAIVAIDPATGGQRPIVALPGYMSVVGINRHTLLVDPGIGSDEAPLTAYTIVAPRGADPGAVSRGGVAADDWPNACALLPPTALRAEFPEANYTAVPRPAPPELNLRAPVGCDLVPRDTRHPILTLSVLWVSGSADEAENIFKTTMTSLTRGLRNATTLRSGVRLYVDEMDATLIRVDRIVVRLDGTRDQGVAERLAHQVARTLRTAA